jgi:transposase-like protein
MKWPAWFTSKFRRKPPAELSPTQCPECSREMDLVEKMTMSGRDLRTYRCKHCRKEYDMDFGTALWKLMSDANKSDE